MTTQAKNKNATILISLVGNLLLAAGKGITGLLANSNALVADAIHSMSDVIAFAINYRACKRCEMVGDVNKEKCSLETDQSVAKIEARATYYTGVFFLIVGMAIYIYNSMLLFFNKVEKPDSITVVVAFVVLAVYVGLYKYTGSSRNPIETGCKQTSRNAHWQNTMNFFTGTVVAIGLIASTLGYVFMDEVAAVVVGSILIAMGVKLTIENKENMSTTITRNQ